MAENKKHSILNAKYLKIPILFLFIFGLWYAGVKAADVTNNFNYSDSSLLVFTNTEGSFSNTNSGEIIRYRITVSNPNWQAKSTKVKFFVPYGFRFVRMVNSAESTIRADGLQIGAFGPGEIRWDYVAPPGETFISFDLQAI